VRLKSIAIIAVFSFLISTTLSFVIKDGASAARLLDSRQVIESQSGGAHLTSKDGSSKFISADIQKVTIDPGKIASYPGSGSTVTDLVSGITGTMSNVGFETSTCGVFSFAGSGRIDFPRTNFGNQFTLSVWVKPTTNSVDIQTIFANAGNGFGSNGFKAFWGYNGITKMVLENGNGGAGAQGKSSNSDVVPGEWQHLVYAFNKDTNQITMYRNGTSIAVQAVNVGMRSDANTDQNWWLGAMSGTSYAMNALIGVVKVYSTVLSSAEVTEDYNSTSARYTATPTCPGPAPTNTAVPTISGTTRVGSTLTAATGTWTGSPSYTYQWQNSPTSGGTYTNIGYATSSTYIPKGESLGKFVRVQVTATGSGGVLTVPSDPTTEILTTTSGAGTPCHLGGTCLVGDVGPGSGVVFYVSNSGFACGPTLAATCTYLEAARDNWNNLNDDYAFSGGNYFWDQRNPKGLIGANAQGTAIGTGYKNTRAAIAFPLDNSGRAVHVADNYSVSAFGATVDDWYLPAKNELLALYTNRPNSLLSFPPGGYWSSTETDASQVGEVNFSNGAWNPNAATFNYDGVRPIRAFSSLFQVPGVPTLTTAVSGDRQITLTFSAGTTGGTPITNYKYSLNSETFTAMATTSSPFTITGLIGRRSYTVRILAVNAIGDSESTTALSATTTDAALDASEAAAAEAARQAAAEAARQAAAESARQAAAEAARVAAEKAAADAKAKADADAKAKADADAKAKADADAKAKADADAKAKADADAKAKADADAKAKADADAKAKAEADAKAKADADAKAKADADAKAKADADAKAKADADAKTKADADAKAKAKADADAKAKADADAKAKADAPAAAAIVSPSEALSELKASSDSGSAPVVSVTVKGKYVASALSAGGNKAALKFTGLKPGTKIKITVKRSVR